MYNVNSSSVDDVFHKMMFANFLLEYLCTQAVGASDLAEWVAQVMEEESNPEEDEEYEEFDWDFFRNELLYNVEMCLGLDHTGVIYGYAPYIAYSHRAMAHAYGKFDAFLRDFEGFEVYGGPVNAGAGYQYDFDRAQILTFLRNQGRILSLEIYRDFYVIIDNTPVTLTNLDYSKENFSLEEFGVAQLTKAISTRAIALQEENNAQREAFENHVEIVGRLKDSISKLTRKANAKERISWT